MLRFLTLLNKQSITKANGDVVVDLIRRAVSFVGIRGRSGKAYVVTEETAMRADLISNYFYRDPSYCDLLLKYNGYSNPFSLNVGDVIRIPNSETLLKFGGSGKGVSSTNTTGNDFITTRKKKSSLVLAPKTQKDKARLDYLMQRGNAIDANLARVNVMIQSGKFPVVAGQTAEQLSSQIVSILNGGSFTGSGPLSSAYQVGNVAPVPPNLALENGVKLANGKIVFGSDVTNIKKEDCPEPISRTKLKESLIKNRIS